MPPKKRPDIPAVVDRVGVHDLLFSDAYSQDDGAHEVQRERGP